ncbi:MAG TPA: ATPase, T2SS/T4P/T4SS family [Lacipirellulaceae bacterium]|nr:ATPase, T2SS/T4P/T4SS family [Lacipirellulaceae bacterium]
MRQRLVICFLLPCLLVAWLLLPTARAQQARGAQKAARAPAQAPGAAAANQPAAPTVPPPKLDKWNDAHSNAMRQFRKGFISWPKLVAILLLILIWVKSADWVNRDSQIFDQGYGKWNPIMLFPFLAILLVFTFPVLVGVSNFWLAFGLLSVCYLATFVPYVITRNKAVELHQKVFTSDWFRYEVAHLANKFGMKMEAERKAEYEKGAPVDLMAIGAAEERENQANLITARQSPGYLLVKDLIAEMVDRRSDRAILDYTQQSVVCRQHIDGVWHNSEARDRESGDVMLAVMKTLANLNATERRKMQEGKFAAKYKEHSFMCPITSQGVTSGERVVLQLLGGFQQTFKKYDDLGMRSKLAEQWAALMSCDKGMLVIAGVPEGGLTTLTDVSLIETDRLLRDFVAVEEIHHREREIENIDVTTYDESKGESAASVLPSLIRKYPNVYVVRDLSDTEAAKLLFNEVRDDDRLLITNVHAKSAPEALLRMLQLKVPHREFASIVTAVLCTRLIRKLCDACKVGYSPTPDLLKKLGIPKGKVEALYRSPKPEEIEKPCKVCGGLGFKDRTAIFELFEVDDQTREILLKKPQLDLVKKSARAAGMRPFQEEGLLLVAKGVTSLAELQRVLKE